MTFVNQIAEIARRPQLLYCLGLNWAVDVLCKTSQINVIWLSATCIVEEFIVKHGPWNPYLWWLSRLSAAFSLMARFMGSFASSMELQTKTVVCRQDRSTTLQMHKVRLPNQEQKSTWRPLRDDQTKVIDSFSFGDLGVRTLAALAMASLRPAA